MKLLLFLDKVIMRLGDIGLVVAMAMMLFIALFGATDVLTTFLFSNPLPLARELSGEFLTLLIFGGMARVTRDRRHIEVDLLIAGAGRSIKLISHCIGLAVGAAVFALLSYRAALIAIHSFEMGEFAAAIFRFPVWPIKIAFAAVICIAFLEFLRQLIWFLSSAQFRNAKNAPQGDDHG